MKTWILALAAALAMTSPALADDDDKNEGKSSRWYSDRPGFNTGYDRGHRDNDRYHHDRNSHDQRYYRDDRRENWLDGEAFALLDRWALWNFDRDRDGRLSRREYEFSQRSFWSSADRNRDGRVTNDEYRDFRNRYLRRDFNNGYHRGWHNGWRW